MRATSKLLALALCAALQPALAGVVSLDFENEANKDAAKIGDRYLASKGVSFTGDAWYLTSNSKDCKGDANFFRLGSCGAIELAKDLNHGASGEASFIVNLSGAGFTEFSFFLSALTGTSVKLELFSGLDATGKVDEFTFDGVGCNPNTNAKFCDFEKFTVDASGTALSLKVTGDDQSLMMDDLTFKIAGGGTNVPEPASMALALGALGAAGWARRRSAR